MREFSSTVESLISSNNIRFFFLIELNFIQNYYLTSHYTDIDFGGNVYIADGGLYEYDSPKQSSVVDRESYRIVISDVSDTLITEFKANVVGKPITVHCGLLDSNNQPLLGTNDLIVVYRGFVDSPSINNDFEQKTAILEGTSPMADLDAVNNFVCSRDGMDQKSSTDTSFDDIFEDSQINIKWGKV